MNQIIEVVNKVERNNRKTRLKELEMKIMNLLEEKKFEPFGEEGLGWFPAKCPACNNLLGQKIASNRLVCIACDKEFELKNIH